MSLEFKDNSTNPDSLVFRNTKNPAYSTLIPLIFKDSNTNSQTGENDLVFYEPLEFREHEPNNDLIFLDYLANLDDFQTNSVLTDFFGQNLNLKKQNDTNQCGVCAILNTLEVLGVEHNWSVLAVRQWVLQNQVHIGLSKLENNRYFDKDGFGNYSELPVDAANFWLGQIDISDFFEHILIGSDYSIDKRFSHEINIKDCDLIILNTGNHFVVCFERNGNWYKVDSLQSPQNLLIRIDQNPLTIPHTSKIFLKKSINLNFT